MSNAWKFIEFDRIPSTQDKAFELLEHDSETPVLVVAREQTQGRGRLDRTWYGESARSLLMTYGFQWGVASINALSLVVGLAVRDAIGRDDLKLKWPNDLMIDDQKVGGILIETRSQGARTLVAIGVGINLFTMQNQHYEGIAKALSPHAVTEKIEMMVTEFQNKGFTQFRASYEKVMWKKGAEVDFIVEGNPRRVQILGVSDEGYLKTKEGSLIRLENTGELSLCQV